jgi:HSP20 family protein
MPTPEPQSGPITASVERLRSELDRWMESAISGGEKALGAFGLGKSGGWRPAFDLVEGHDEVVVRVDLPGVEPEAIDVALAGNMLTLKGRRIVPGAEGSDLLHVRNRPEGEFQQSIPMPAPVNADAVTADVANGVLTIRLGKAESSKSKQIRINTPSQP